MSVVTKELVISTPGEDAIIDLTDDLNDFVKKSKIQNGIAHLFVVGSTGALTTVEYEPGLLQDIPAALERLIPRDITYAHHETWHDDNGHSHVRASLIGPSLTVPIRDGSIVHGTWQQIVFLELDTSAHTRRILVTIIGE
jgi:secondary thiamine-phosphate synthase enzyme